MSGGKPSFQLRENIRSILILRGLKNEKIDDLLDDIPKRWEKFDDIALIPNSSFRKEQWKSIINDEFWTKVCQSLNIERLARSGEIVGEKRESTVEMLVGNNDWVIRKENGIKYGYHITQCMFSSGNINERRRMGEIVTENEIVVDLFCGIGYYTLPILMKDNVKHVYSCEWNINAIKALKFNLDNNNVKIKCTILEGDNRVTTDGLENIADRVLLGLLPTAEESYNVALKCLKEEGGVLHIHGLAPSGNHQVFLSETTEKLLKINLNYKIINCKINKIKSYAPHWDHLVLDIEIGKNNS
jgi:tRNA wybutosine-synthesizing protein 3